MSTLTTILKILVKRLRDLISGPTQPGLIMFRTGATVMAKQVFILLPTGDEPQDIVKGELTVTATVGGETSTSTIDTTFGQAEAGPFMSDFDDTQMSVSFCYVDDAGLRSVPREAVLVIDATPPNQPGDISFRIEDEVV